jgi:hypothetical protein
MSLAVALCVMFAWIIAAWAWRLWRTIKRTDVNGMVGDQRGAGPE